MAKTNSNLPNSQGFREVEIVEEDKCEYGRHAGISGRKEYAHQYYLQNKDRINRRNSIWWTSVKGKQFNDRRRRTQKNQAYQKSYTELYYRENHSEIIIRHREYDKKRAPQRKEYFKLWHMKNKVKHNKQIESARKKRRLRAKIFDKTRALLND